MKKVTIFLAVLSIGTSLSAGMCSYYIEDATKKMSKTTLVMERNASPFEIELIANSTIISLEGAIVECEGVVPEKNIERFREMRKSYIDISKRMKNR